MKKSEKIGGVLLLAAVLGYGTYVLVLKWHRQSLETSLEQRTAALQTESDRLQREIEELKDELAAKQEAKLPEQKLREVFGQDAEGMLGAQAEGEASDRKVREFFAYLDGRDYVKAYGLDTGTFETFQGMMKKLAEHPPVVSAELKDPFLLVRNVAHFYRVVGKRDLSFARDVIVNESELAEPIGALLFEWALPESPQPSGAEGRPSLKTLYEYAGFFLNSVAGRSYLLRRDPKVRVLTRYYSVRIVDRANREEINRHGIDIRPHIDSVLEEIRSQRGLVYQQEYIDVLEGLQEEYAKR